MAISKLIFNGDVQMDVTDDTVTSTTLFSGSQATGNDGEKIQGGYVEPAAVTQATPTITVNTTSGIITASATQSAGRVAAGTKSTTQQLTTQAAKTVTPTETEQTAVAANRYTTGAVKVAGISSTYVGSGITRDPTPTASGNVVTIPAGYFTASTTKSVATVAHPNPTVSVNTTNGLITAQHTQSAGYVTASTTTATTQLITQSAATITPTTTTQTAVPAGRYTIGAVKVAPIPPSYIIPSGTKSITANGTGIDVTEYASVDVAVPVGQEINNQTKNATPSETAQTVTYDSGYTGLEKVNIAAISSTYVGSGITRNPTPTASGNVVTIPAGYFTASTTKSVATVAQATPGITVNSTGLITASATQGAGYVAAGTKSTTQQLTVKSSSDMTVSGKTVTAPAGYYTSAQTKSVADGTAGTPTATKGTVSNHSVTVTPSVTNTTGYITGDTKTGTPVSVTAAELVSGTKSITSNGNNIDVTDYAAVNVNVSSPIYVGTLEVTPDTEVQMLYASDDNLDGYYEVIVDAIPPEYVIPSGTKQITANGSDIDVASYESVDVSVPGYKLLYSGEVNVNTSSTSAAQVGSRIALPATAETSDAILYVKIRDKAGPRAGYFVGSDTYFFNFEKAGGYTTALNGAARTIHRRSTSGVYTSYSPGGTAGYGVYANSISNTGTGALYIYARYSSTYSYTINGTYTVEAYLLDYAGSDGNPYE